LQVADLIEAMQREDPNLLNGMSRQEAQRLVSNVFARMNGTLAGTKQGVVTYAGLGRFRINSVNKPGAAGRTRIVFRPR
jgi:hypothetical protein